MANEVFARFRDTILFLQDGEAEKHAALNTTIPQNPKVRAKRHLNLNFGRWPAISFNYPTDGRWQAVFPSDFARELCEQDERICPINEETTFGDRVTHICLDFEHWKNPEVVEQHRVALDYFRDEFGSYKGSSYDRHHNSKLYEAILNPELRASFLEAGFSPAMSKKYKKYKEPKARPPVDLDPGPEPNPRAYTRDDALRDLFVKPTSLDRMVSLLRRKKNLVLQGAPGTGKTFIAKRLAYLLMEEKDETRVEMVQFHQSTSYEDFVQGFRPDEEGRFLLTDGVFHEFCRRAAESGEDVPHVFLIDEINRGNLSKIFGELMLLIEPDKRGEEHAIGLAYGKADSERFHVPENVHLIGTMNTADRSLSLVDYALRRRFAFFEMEPGFGSPSFDEVLVRRHVPSSVVERIRRAMGTLNELIAGDPGLGRGHRIGHSFFVPTRNVENGEAWFREIVEFEILPLIEEYWIDDESRRKEAAAIFEA